MPWPGVTRRKSRSEGKRLTILGRSVLLLGSLLAFNGLCWVLAGILFGRKESTREVLSLCVLAWTYGLRHALDSDHISAIDNATRGLLALGQQPVTCGFFFSLGHSTIVIAVNVAIAISTTVFEHLDGVGNVGGIVGTAVSASFLFLLATANSIILYTTLRRKRARERQIAAGLPVEPLEHDIEPIQNRTLMMRILGPVMRVVDKPWKMYPVGVLFGFGFDTASTIALLAVSAIAKSAAQGNIVILPFLFTAGMTLVDSIDSVLMLYSYALPSRHTAEGALAFFERKEDQAQDLSQPQQESIDPISLSEKKGEEFVTPLVTEAPPGGDEIVAPTPAQVMNTHLEHNKATTLSSLSIILTLLSILVAFSISLIEIMGLIGDNCGPCQDAANAPDGGGLAGSWWRAWDAANDASGYIGASIVGVFVCIVLVYFGGKWAYQRSTRKAAGQSRDI
ncbi:NicO-domain-containing protein [Dacryopinax primogenitus]|uniref:Nickel/cobalt efflux system n=1 Tax=Dacryopinax primogenitus (strain DJM 731) TaxID=1858805 RepID=M5GEB6_DACPD|nr:NicO-domain-containing protein [Dacryopinax primogenitus]EJU03133.1 NicO-domain-containing protein [Dacryopinax primogenitus]